VGHRELKEYAAQSCDPNERGRIQRKYCSLEAACCRKVFMLKHCYKSRRLIQTVFVGLHLLDPCGHRLGTQFAWSKRNMIISTVGAGEVNSINMRTETEKGKTTHHSRMVASALDDAVKC
jgi:hypothetical protein